MQMLEFRDVHVHYGAIQALKGISFSVEAGKIVTLVGANGAGKSTTVKILCGLITDYEGDVSIKKFDVKEQTIEVKKRIGYVPELAELYEVLTPMEFLQLIGELHHLDKHLCQERIVRIMTAFGLENHLHQRMDSFSKGMRQKVLIASGILHNPDVIVLDEPLSGLDANSVLIVKELISRLAEDGKTIFYCSHMMDIVERLSHRIVLIDNGSVIADGSVAELKQQQGNKSLEQIFAHLTAKDSIAVAAEELMKAFRL